MIRTKTQGFEGALPQLEQGASDDIASLADCLHTGKFDYVDIRMINAQEKALSSWPLLAESIDWYENQP